MVLFLREADIMDKVYQVIEGYYFISETHETILGTYSTEENAQIRLEKLKQQAKVNPDHVFIKEIVLDVDVDIDINESCICG
jgi:hypothetical protein